MLIPYTLFSVTVTKWDLEMGLIFAIQTVGLNR